MRWDIVRHIRKQASQLAFNNALYHWSLGGSVPDAICVVPIETWPGDADRGRWLCNGSFAANGAYLEIGGNVWQPEGVDEAWLVHMHSFEWLRDLRALGGEQARRQACHLLKDWMEKHHHWDPLVWRPDIMGQRLANWVIFFEFYSAGINDDLQRELFDSLVRQSRHLGRALPGGMEGIALLYAIKGLAFAGLAMEKYENWLSQALDLLQDEITKQILSDGAHISRSPAKLVEAARVIIDTRSGLTAAGYTVPEEIEHVIDRMVQALRFFRYPDKGLGLFNGTQEGDSVLVDAVMTRANSRGRVLTRLPSAGYERVTVGRSLLMVDSGTPPPYPYDAAAHAAPLSFEFAYGRERIFVNCGTHLLDENWRNMLRGSAAHNGAAIDYRNICEIRGDGHFGRKPRKVVVTRDEGKGACLIEGTHDGYVPLNGITHRRRLFLTDQGHNLRGEESFSCTVGISKPAEIAVRFHLHPRVLVSLIKEGEEALLRLKGGAGWRFIHSGGLMALEDSVYLGEGAEPRKTKQLVIYGRMEHDYARIKWGLKRETR